MFQNPIETQYQACCNSCALFQLDQHGLIYIEGKDATRYLHGRLTQDIKSLATFSGAPSLLLTPTGRTLGRCLVVKTENGFILIADPDSPVEITNSVELASCEVSSVGTGFLSSLLQFKVADDLVARNLRPDTKLLSLQGPTSSAILSKLGCKALPNKLGWLTISQVENLQIQIVYHPRGACCGYDLILAEESCNELLVRLTGCIQSENFLVGSEEGRQMLRIRAKIPETGYELTEKTIATEIDVIPYVSFNKGCYAGQEVVEMSTARGRPNRRLELFKTACIKESPVLQDSILTDLDGKKCGELTSICHDKAENHYYFLAFVKNSLPLDTEFKIAGLPCFRTEQYQEEQYQESL